MKPAALLSVFVFSLVAVAHLIRLVFGVEVLVDGASLPMWVSAVGVLVAGGLALALWRESQPDSP